MDVIFDWNLGNMIYNGLITLRLCGFPFVEIRSLHLPLGMRRFHDWYLHVLPTTIDLIQACFPAGTFGGLAEKIIFDFNDI